MNPEAVRFSCRVSPRREPNSRFRMMGVITLSGGTMGRRFSIFGGRGSNSIVAVTVETGATFRAGAPQALFQAPLRNLSSSRTVFVLSPDGQRILANQLLEESIRTPITVVANWDAELNKK